MSLFSIFSILSIFPQFRLCRLCYVVHFLSIYLYFPYLLAISSLSLFYRPNSLFVSIFLNFAPFLHFRYFSRRSAFSLLLSMFSERFRHPPFPFLVWTQLASIFSIFATPLSFSAFGFYYLSFISNFRLFLYLLLIFCVSLSLFWSIFLYFVFISPQFSLYRYSFSLLPLFGSTFPFFGFCLNLLLIVALFSLFFSSFLYFFFLYSLFSLLLSLFFSLFVYFVSIFGLSGIFIYFLYFYRIGLI